ncbi:hypothetical protein [Flavobacterium sp. 5]|uniref:hypothetical protein n=1 Tax=Flavobacterium sp. 5 TaxID=2035199 RepID=UPI000C2C1D5C|nr:hypothetical protein [Flavobacterium sp. 5]PKB16943.1 hypothetical protein CLU82_2101 [Flavobacterium sp. 5]
MKLKIELLGLVTLVLFSCSDKKQEVKEEKNIVKDGVSTISDTVKTNPQVIIDSTEIKLKNFMVHDYIKDDMKFLTESDHKFQFENIDLNGDAIPETFVRFSSPYFCGSGGCTFLLLDNHQKIITKFTVMEAPVYIENTTKNGWAVLLVNDRGVFKDLSFNGKKYPSNPSVLPKSSYDDTSDHSTILFDKPFAEGKISIF